MKILITGAGGQLGRTLLQTAPAGIVCCARSSSELDISGGDLTAAVAASGAELVINAAAYTAVDKAEAAEGRGRAFAVNGQGAGALAAACAALRIRLLHVSTDFVFDGGAGSPYAPAAAARPLGVYGASKLEGEQRVSAALPTALIVRTAWVYSRHGNNFVKTLLRLLAERDALNVVCDQMGTPTWTATLAAALWDFAARPQLAGIYHYTDAGVASWYDFAVAIQEEALALGLLEREIPVRPITSAEYPLPARRPAFSVLDKSATYRDLGCAAVHWRVALRRMLQDYRDQPHG
jgi:dTDP-4-dehydrorhamnose reductase